MDNKTEINVPSFLLELLKEQYPADVIKKIIDGYSKKRKVTIRVNTIKTDVDRVKAILLDNNIQFTMASWSSEALIIENTNEEALRNMEIYQNGEIYLQSLSSMLPPIILEPEPEEDILDMCAAPRRKNYSNCSFNKQCGKYYCM